MKTINHIRCPLCGKLSRRRNFDRSPHVIEIKIQEIGGDKHIRWYKANDEILTKQITEFISKKLEDLIRSLKKEKLWHISKSTSIRAVPSSSYSMTDEQSFNQKIHATRVTYLRTTKSSSLK